MKIIGIPGSLRRESVNRRLLLAAAHELPPGTTLEVWDGLGRVPPFNEDDEAGPVHPAVAELRSVIGSADAVLIATPEYNGSLSGQLKNALDWASRPRGSAVLQNKRVATVSASPTPYGGAWAQETLRKVLSVIGAELSGGEFAVPQAYQQFDQDGRLADPQLRHRLAELVAELVDAPTGVAT